MGCYIMFFGTKLWVAFGNQTGILGSGDCELIAGIEQKPISIVTTICCGIQIMKS